jgi:hypothetical protein
MSLRLATKEEAADVLLRANKWFASVKPLWNTGSVPSAVAEYIANTEFNATLHVSRIESHANTTTK